MKSTFLPYETPSIIQLLTLGSFLLLLPAFKLIFQRLIFAGILGPLVLGIIYGVPLADILTREWQETFLALGYLGLILLIFEGGMTTRLDLLRANMALSLVCALVGVGGSMALSFAVLSAGLGYPLSEAFVLGAALSATSLGTTFAILGRLGQSRIGTVIMSAAMIDDVVGCECLVRVIGLQLNRPYPVIMASIVTSLGKSASPGGSVGWAIGRPVMAACLLTIIVPICTRYLLKPVYDRFLFPYISPFAPYGHAILMILTLAGLCAAAEYAGTSVLYGAYVAGAALAYLDAHPPPHPPTEDRATFLDVFHKMLGPVQSALLEPLFFASIGFAIPFLSAWRGAVVWQGLVYASAMVAGKLLVGVCVPLWIAAPHAFWALMGALHIPLAKRRRINTAAVRGTLLPATILGSAMVARGEIGLLILELGYVQAGRLSERGFLVGVWAVVLNTLLGPIAVGLLMRRIGGRVLDGPWGDVKEETEKTPTSTPIARGDSQIRASTMAG
jgi:Kef-type K+ transport system membrane component KefB